MTDNVTDVTRLALLRHGACEGGEIFRGSTDVPLSDDGWQQMRAAIDRCDAWDYIVTSPLQRCQSFAADLAQRTGASLEVDEDLREMHFGDWEGQAIRDIWEQDAAFCRRFFSDPVNHTPPQAEPMLDVDQRVASSWQRSIERCRGSRVLLVSHGGVLRLILARVLQMPLSAIARVHIGYAAFCSVDVHHADVGDLPVLTRLDGGLEQH